MDEIKFCNRDTVSVPNHNSTTKTVIISTIRQVVTQPSVSSATGTHSPVNVKEMSSDSLHFSDSLNSSCVTALILGSLSNSSAS